MALRCHCCGRGPWTWTCDTPQWDWPGLVDGWLGLAGTGHSSALLMVGTGTGVPISEVGLDGTGDSSPYLA